MTDLRRRHFLRAAGVSLAIPAMASTSQGAGSDPAFKTPSTGEGPRRMVCIGNMLGFYPDAFWPQEEGAKFQFGQSTQALQSHQQDLTVISGLDHGVKGGHFGIHAFLSGVRHIDVNSMPDGNITLDQFAAERLQGQTRFPSLTIGSQSGIHGGCQMSWTRSGTRVPPISGPRRLFEKLFVGVTPADRQQAEQRFQLRQSILDEVRGDARALHRSLNPADRQKLDEYLTSVRDVERRLTQSHGWMDVPKPQPPLEMPKDSNMVDDLPMLYDLMALALQTDSTRIATLEIGGDFEARDFGFRTGYHALSHHGQRPESIRSLITIDTYQIEQFARFLTKLRSLQEGESNLLQQTMVLFGSGMGNANSHTNTNLPVVLAGGGFDHGKHLSYKKNKTRPPLTNLFVSMLQQMGIETDHFATSTGTLLG